jgi:hypothetical protein
LISVTNGFSQSGFSPFWAKTPVAVKMKIKTSNFFMLMDVLMMIGGIRKGKEKYRSFQPT